MLFIMPAYLLCPAHIFHNLASERAFRNDVFYEPDVLFLAGMYATSEAFINDGSCITYEFAKELRKKKNKLHL